MKCFDWGIAETLIRSWTSVRQNISGTNEQSGVRTTPDSRSKGPMHAPMVLTCTHWILRRGCVPFRALCLPLKGECACTGEMCLQAHAHPFSLITHPMLPPMGCTRNVKVSEIIFNGDPHRSISLQYFFSSNLSKALPNTSIYPWRIHGGYGGEGYKEK